VELATGDETVVTHGEAFGVSPDGTKVAVGRKCAQPDRTTCVQVWLHDVASGTESQLPLNPKDPSLDPISTGGWVQMLWSPDGTQVIGVAGHMVRPVAVHFDVPAAGKTASNGTVLDLEQPQANAIAMGDQYSLAWSSHGLLASTNEFGLSPSGATANIVGFQPEDRTSRTPFTQLGPLFSTTTMQLGDVIQPGATMYVVADTAAKGSTSSWSGHPHLYQVKAGGELVNLGGVSPRGGAIVAVPSR
jgi:hypothetical protein